MDGYKGHKRSDLTLFSFGSIKTATALAGGLCRVRNETLRSSLKKTLGSYTRKNRWFFLMRILKRLVLKTLGLHLVFTTFFRIGKILRIDYDALLLSIVRSFQGADLASLIQRQPCLPQLALLQRRLKHYRHERLEGRAKASQRMNQQLPTHLRGARYANPNHTWWLFPISIPNGKAVVDQLVVAGFDATISPSQLCAVTGRNGPAANCATFMAGVVYLPVRAGIPTAQLDKLATLLQRVTQPHRAESGAATTAVIRP